MNATNVLSQIVTVLLSLLGGGFIGLFAKSFLDKRYHKFSEIFELKQRRYKVILILMWTALHPSSYELRQLARHRPDIKTVEELNRELELEYYHAMFFASDGVLKALKLFNEQRTTQNWELATKEMRKDLYR